MAPRGLGLGVHISQLEKRGRRLEGEKKRDKGRKRGERKEEGRREK